MPDRRSMQSRNTKIPQRTWRFGMPVPDRAGCRTRTMNVEFNVRAVEVGIEEMRQALELRDQLRVIDGIKSVNVAQEQSLLQLKITLEAPASTEDELLTNMFLKMRPVVESSTLLQEGLCEEKPCWRAVKRDDFTADSGPFVLESSDAQAARQLASPQD